MALRLKRWQQTHLLSLLSRVVWILLGGSFWLIFVELVRFLGGAPLGGALDVKFFFLCHR